MSANIGTITLSLNSWSEYWALKILTTPFFCSGTTSFGEPIDVESICPFNSFSDWVDSNVRLILRMRGDLNSKEDEERFNPYLAVEQCFPVLESSKDNKQILQPLVDDLLKALRCE
jgi:hypothetical protein